MTQIVYAISKQSDGNMSFRYGPTDHVLQNRNNFLSSHGIVPDNCVAMNLQNGNECVIVTGKDKSRGMKSFDGIAADCLITNEKGVFLFTFVGDCLPLTIHDTGASIVALAHISRHNAGERFIQKIITTIIQYSASGPKHLICNIGPCIRRGSYLLPLSVPQASDPVWQPFITWQPNGNASLDLAGLTTAMLIKNEVAPNNIHDPMIDTVASSDYFSHYRDARAGAPEGRFAVVAGMH
jgi:copper oxidase (laccase) domain-containing protein